MCVCDCSRAINSSRQASSALRFPINVFLVTDHECENHTTKPVSIYFSWPDSRISFIPHTHSHTQYLSWNMRRRISLTLHRNEFYTQRREKLSQEYSRWTKESISIHELFILYLPRMLEFRSNRIYFSICQRAVDESGKKRKVKISFAAMITWNHLIKKNQFYSIESNVCAHSSVSCALDWAVWGEK